MTYKPKSEFLRVMQSRGFLADCTDMEGLDERLIEGTVTAYIGFDATADSLHVGSLIQIMMLRWLQKTGHRPITLMGGGTTKIGDPSGKDESRQLMTPDMINANIKGIGAVFAKYLDYGDTQNGALMANNADWLDQLNYVEFLRDYGRHFTINRMLTFDSVKLRLEREQPLTFLEFNYMLLQAYDFKELNSRFDCALQMGGSDQWGNIVNGIDLTRRINRNEVFGLTTPLLTKADGSKMGKSAAGAVWLNEDKLSSYEFWQFWRNTLDADVGRFLKLFTELPLDECERLAALQGSEINEAKIKLADAATALCHSEEKAKKAEMTAEKVFGEGGVGEALKKVSFNIDELNISGWLSAPQMLVKAGFSNSNKEAKRLIMQGGVRINNVVVTDPKAQYVASHFETPLKLSAGKKRHAIIELTL